jgi:hypothetical protein
MEAEVAAEARLAQIAMPTAEEFGAAVISVELPGPAVPGGKHPIFS